MGSFLIPGTGPGWGRPCLGIWVLWSLGGRCTANVGKAEEGAPTPPNHSADMISSKITECHYMLGSFLKCFLFCVYLAALGLSTVCGLVLTRNRTRASCISRES